MLIVYSLVGGGHLSAARALAEELESTGQASVRLVDAYRECARFPLTLFPAAYARLARSHPRVWSMVYHASDKRWTSDTRWDLTRVIGPFLARGFARMLAAERPDLVVSVLPAINGPLADSVNRSGGRLEVVLTDWHAVHRLWVARGVDHYTAPTDAARDDCIRFGAQPESVDVVGIPVRPAFAKRRDSQSVRQQHLASLGLDPRRFTILAMVGAEGSPRALDNIAALAQLELQAQMVVVCGRNDTLRMRIQRLPARLPLRAVGFVDHVADLMAAADVLVTKAGGLSLAEAFSSGVPVVVHDVVPGQESGNLEYALRRQAVAFASNSRALAELISDLTRDAAQRQMLVDGGRSLARPDAARHIARNLLGRIAP